MIQKNTFQIDSNQHEIVSYSDPSFPVEIWAGDIPELSNHGLPIHWHEDYEYAVILKGQMVYEFQNAPVILKAGDCLFINSNTLHATRQLMDSDPVFMFTVAFQPFLLAENNRGLIYQKYIYPIKQQKFDCIYITEDVCARGKSIKEILYTLFRLDHSRAGYELLALGRVAELWLETFYYIQETMDKSFHGLRNSGMYSENLKSALNFIYKHYSEKINIDEIARAANVSRNTCFRYFQNSFGKTPLDILNSYRLTIAAKLLVESDEPVTEIALRCGFSSSSYFEKLFKRGYNMTPVAYPKNKNAAN